METLGSIPEETKEAFKNVVADVGRAAAAHGISGVPTEIVIGAMAYALVLIAEKMEVDPVQLKFVLNANIDLLYSNSQQPKPTMQ